MTDAPLARVVEAIRRSGLEYMLTGSYASNVYGRVRSTFDADFVVRPQGLQPARLAELLGGEFYLDAASMAEVQEAGGQFNAIHVPSGLKVDFYLLRGGEYPALAFKRRRSAALWGGEVWVISPEDLVLAKLLWAKEGGSQRQVEDAKGIMEVQAETLDLPYLREWAAKLTVSGLLEDILPPGPMAGAYSGP